MSSVSTTVPFERQWLFQSELERTLQMVQLTGSPTVILFGMRSNELDTLLTAAHHRHLRVITMPAGSLILLPAIPLDDDELHELCVAYCSATDESSRNQIRDNLFHRHSQYSFPLFRADVDGLKVQYKPAEYVMRFVEACYEVYTTREEELPRLLSVNAYLHVPPMMNICCSVRPAFALAMQADLRPGLFLGSSTNNSNSENNTNMNTVTMPNSSDAYGDKLLAPMPSTTASSSSCCSRDLTGPVSNMDSVSNGSNVNEPGWWEAAVTTTINGSDNKVSEECTNQTEYESMNYDAVLHGNFNQTDMESERSRERHTHAQNKSHHGKVVKDQDLYDIYYGADEQASEKEDDLTGLETVDVIKTVVAEYPCESDYQLITNAAVFDDGEGDRRRLAAVYLREVLSPEECALAAEILEPAATQRNLRALTNGGVPPNTGIVGYYDYLNNPTRYKCRQTKYMRENERNVNDKCGPLLHSLDNLYAQCAPEHYKLQNTAIPTAYRLCNTVFSTITVNKEFRTAMHADRGDFKSGLAALCVVNGNFNGCYLAIKKLKIMFELKVGDVLFFDTFLDHGNTEVYSPDPSQPDCWTRTSLVFYLRTGLLSSVCEVERRRRLNMLMRQQIQSLPVNTEEVINVNQVDRQLPPLYVPVQVARQLATVQLSALSFILERLHRQSGCVVAMTMGLGKTLVALSLCFSMLISTPDKHVMIIVPKPIIPHWTQEYIKWRKLGLKFAHFVVSDGSSMIDIEQRSRSTSELLEMSLDNLPLAWATPDLLSSSIAHNSTGNITTTSTTSVTLAGGGAISGQATSHQRGHVFVLNPESLTRFRRRYGAIEPALLIVDEGHKLGSKTSHLTEQLDRFICPLRVVLSGTPVQNDAEELYRLITWISPSVRKVFPPRKFQDLAVQIKNYINGNDYSFDKAVLAQEYLQDWMRGFVFREMEVDLPPLHDYLLICGSSSLQQELQAELESVIAQSQQQQQQHNNNNNNNKNDSNTINVDGENHNRKKNNNSKTNKNKKTRKVERPLRARSSSFSSSSSSCLSTESTSPSSPSSPSTTINSSEAIESRETSTLSVSSSTRRKDKKRKTSCTSSASMSEGDELLNTANTARSNNNKTHGVNNSVNFTNNSKERESEEDDKETQENELVTSPVDEMNGGEYFGASEHRPFHLSTHPLCYYAFISGAYRSMSGRHVKRAQRIEDARIAPEQRVALSFSALNFVQRCYSLVDHDEPEQFTLYSGKMMALVRIMQLVVSRNEKAIIFSQYVGTQDLIHRVLTAFHISAHMIRGRDSVDRRCEAMREFNQNPTMHVLVLSTRIAAYGLDFSVANHVLLFDSWWNPQVDAQAIARAYRRNQRKEVTVYRLASELEDLRILSTQMRKLALFDCLIREKTTQIAPKAELVDCANDEANLERRELWWSLKNTALHGDCPVLLRVHLYRNSVREAVGKCAMCGE